MTFDECESFVQSLHDDYVSMVEGGMPEEDALSSILDSLSNEDMLRAIWGAGIVRDAFEYVHEELEDAIANG